MITIIQPDSVHTIPTYSCIYIVILVSMELQVECTCTSVRVIIFPQISVKQKAKNKFLLYKKSNKYY